jgi:molecular chaperone HtpG
MAAVLASYAEKRAEKAEELLAFSGVKLLHIKQELATLLNLIGRGGIFDTYTNHDISHIDEMLKILDWLIPDNTKNIMTPADWLMTVLSIYFHDLGMLVSKQEYELRQTSGFPEYRNNVLFSGDKGKDYQAQIKNLSPDMAERFLYQEFVRYKHAERIRAWVTGKAPDHLGITHNVMSEVDTLLQPLALLFRRDLALICESHHLDDLNNLKKYKISQPYGNSDAETVNLQYVAILMRTADLLHITSDRTPSITFRVISPADPLSQEEWAKQMAVTRVRPQIGRNRDGNLDEAAPRDTIEVHAYFTKESGFFGLTSYLIYAESQIRKCYDWVKMATQLERSHYQFPWRGISSSNIETAGFLQDTFEFKLDQEKILDLLTGHTLYNDTKIVLRELVQNAFDAVRLQYLNDSENNIRDYGRVDIYWDSKKRILTVEDNGTGMTQNIIERHLLNVGSSRYQDADFKKQYPDFSPISRFGIGVLSAFMLADTIEIITCHPDDEEARQLSLRSVHGRYLIRLLDKQNDEIAKRLTPHGTIVKLYVRPSAEIPDIIETAQTWIVIPGFKVYLTVDDSPPMQLGFSSPKEAVASVLHKRGILYTEKIELDGNRVKIEQKEENGVTLAYALEWSEYFKEWTFLSTTKSEEKDPLFLGTCIEGIRVLFTTPGFDQFNIVAIANVTGPNAPRTNVARSGIEITLERDNMLSTIYSMYCNHVRDEIQKLHGERAFSLTWATQEATYILKPLTEGNASNRKLLEETAEKLPLFLVERAHQRESISSINLSREPNFWTIDCSLFKSAEWLIREIQSQISLSSLVNVLDVNDLQLPDGLILCGFNNFSRYSRALFFTKEIDTIKVFREQRRVDFRWVERADPPRWYIPYDDSPNSHDLLFSSFSGVDAEFMEVIRSHPKFFELVSRNVWFGEDDINISGISDEIAIQAFGVTYFLPNSPITKYIIPLIKEVNQNQTGDLSKCLHRIMAFFWLHFNNQTTYKTKEEFYRIFFRDVNRDQRSMIENSIDMNELYEITSSKQWKIFNPSAWTRDK